MQAALIEAKANERQCRELGRHLGRENERMGQLPGKIHPLNREITRVGGRITQLRQRIRLLSSAPTSLLRGPLSSAADIAIAVERANIEAEISSHEADLARLEAQRDELERQLREATDNARSLS